jgi:6,7-dimethyl-8-ribityllumazine synthase
MNSLHNQTASFPIALVVSSFNQDITNELKEGALRRLHELGFSEQEITVIDVPGAVEIPIIAQKIAQKGRCKAIVALGAVIRGDTSHYDYVCQQVSNGCQTVSLTVGVPVIFGVLTTENEAQAWDRLGGSHGHKGIEAIDCAVTMVRLMQQL